MQFLLFLMRSRLGQIVNVRGIGRAVTTALVNPSLAIPHVSVKDISHLSWPELRGRGFNWIVFDKDNTLTLPYEKVLHPRVEASFRSCVETFGGDRVVVFSNTAGSPDDHGDVEARAIESAWGIKVLRHSKRKPGGGEDLDALMRPSGMTRAVVVGDRFMTDIVFANLNHHMAVHVEPLDASLDRKGVQMARKMEAWLVKRWMSQGLTAPQLRQ